MNKRLVLHADRGETPVHGSVVNFYKGSDLTNERSDAFNNQVNLGPKHKTNKQKEQDIFQKVCGASCLGI